MKNYSLIKDNIVENIIVFDNPSQELLNHFKNVYLVDDIIEANERATIGGIWDGTNFIPKQPYPSWEDYDEENGVWLPPFLPPEGLSTNGNNDFYVWNEDIKNWVLSE